MTRWVNLRALVFAFCLLPFAIRAQPVEKSPELVQLKMVLDRYDGDIAQKAAACEKMAADSLPAEQRERCRTELVVLNALRDSTARVEKRLRDDVGRLAEAFSAMKAGSERLRLARQLFEEGKFRAAENALDAQKIEAEGDALLLEKEAKRGSPVKTEALLRTKAEELSIKAQLKATDLADPLRFDSAGAYFEQSLRFAEGYANALAFARLLSGQNQWARAAAQYERALKLASPDSPDEAAVANDLALALAKAQKREEAEAMYLRALDAYERLARADSARFEPKLAQVLSTLGTYRLGQRRMEEAETLLMRAVLIYEKYAPRDSVQFDPMVASVASNLGFLYSTWQKLPQATQMYLRAMFMAERLAKRDPAQYSLLLARTSTTVGSYFYRTKDYLEMGRLSVQALEIFDRLAKNNPAPYEPDLATLLMNLGNYYEAVEQPAEAEAHLLRALPVVERLARQNTQAFEPKLALAYFNLGVFYNSHQRMAEAEKAHLRALEIYERLAVENPAQFRPQLVETVSYLSSASIFLKKYTESERFAIRALNMDPSKNWVRAFIGHSRLLRGDWAGAQPVYERFLAEEADKATAKKSLAEDLDELEAAGLTCQEMEKAREWLKSI